MDGMSEFDPEDIPTRQALHEQLMSLITGRASREEVAGWAARWVTGDVAVSDAAVWTALVRLSGADLISTDRPYLHTEADFCAWLEQLRSTPPT